MEPPAPDFSEYKEEPKSELAYTVTNERIESVLAGFGMDQFSHPRRILAVGGSGDIPFALLPYVDHIDVVDSNPAQISFIKDRIKQLDLGDSTAFLNPSVVGSTEHDTESYKARLSRRNSYFMQPEVLESVRANLGRMTVIDPKSIFDFLESTEEKYSGVYLSNILGLLGNQGKILEHLSAIQQKIDPNGGKLYVANGDTVEALTKQTGLPSGLYVDPMRTNAARQFGEYAGGVPTVYGINSPAE